MVSWKQEGTFQRVLLYYGVHISKTQRDGTKVPIFLNEEIKIYMDRIWCTARQRKVGAEYLYIYGGVERSTLWVDS